MTSTLGSVRTLLRESVSPSCNPALFFKTGEGQYAAHDQFMGVTVPTVRKIAKQFSNLSLDDIQTLLESSINEERLLALVLVVDRYQKGSLEKKEFYYQFYLQNMRSVNNWNLVDSSAHLIVGAHLFSLNRDLLISLAHSKDLWERRIAIVATWYFIRQDDLEWTFTITKLLLNDTHDLIHKAVGWMLREAGKKNQEALVAFLDLHAARMPRTMLRYAIEKFSPDVRKSYLAQRLER